MTKSDLVFIYKTVIRPVLDFASVTYHSMLTLEMTKSLEDLQNRALKIIYGVHLDYENLLETSNIPRLSERREEMFKKFALKSTKNDKIKDTWFPKKTNNGYNTRMTQPYQESTASTERLKNSPIYQMRKFLNTLHET